MQFIMNGDEQEKKKAQTAEPQKAAKRKNGKPDKNVTATVVDNTSVSNTVSTDDDSGISSVDIPVDTKQRGLPPVERLLG